MYEKLQEEQTDLGLAESSAVVVYFELGLLDPSLHHDYIMQYYDTEDGFWELLEQTGLKLPYL